jgi:hypothetical protein
MMTTLFLLSFAGPAFAQDVDVAGKLQGLGEQILAMLTGGVAKAIISCAFAGSCIAYAVNKDNEQAKQKIIAVIIATVLLGMAQWIVTWVLGAATAK